MDKFLKAEYQKDELKAVQPKSLMTKIFEFNFIFQFQYPNGRMPKVQLTNGLITKDRMTEI